MKIKNKKIYIWLIGLLGLTLFFAVPKVLAQVSTGIEFGAYTGLVNTDIRIIIAKIIRAALGLLGILAVCLIIYGGYEYMTAGGKEEQIEKAKDIIKNTAIGLAIILSSFAIAQFVISSLTTAIIGGYCSSNPTAPECLPGYCKTHPNDAFCIGPDNSCKGAGCDIFYATSTPRGQLPIKNPVIFVNFFRGSNFTTAVDPLTVSSTPSSPSPFQNIIVFKTSDAAQTPVSGYFQFLYNNTVAVFHPQGSCADTALGLGAGNNDCLEKNTSYTVKFKTSADSNDINSLRDTTSFHRAIDCTNHSCEGTFITGSKVDLLPPTVKMNKPASPGLVEQNYWTTIGASYSDDVGVNFVRFDTQYDLNQAWYNVHYYGVPDNYFYAGTPASLFGQADHSFFPNPFSGYELKAIYQTIQASAYDFAGHLSLSTNRIKNLPPFCWNGIVEPQYKETQAGIAHIIPDCGLGSECGSCPGQACTDNIDCAGTYCDLTTKTCVARPKITEVSPNHGTVMNYVSINGYGFGNSIGKVFFVTSTGSTQLEIASCSLNSPPTQTWSKFNVVVKVPPSTIGVTSTIRLETSNYNATSNPLLYDSTSDKGWGWEGFFTYDGTFSPGLACVKPNSGHPGDKNVQMAGSNLGNKLIGYLQFGDLKIDPSLMSSSDWGGIGGYTLIKNVVVPNLPEQILSLKAVVNGIESNSLPFTILAAAEDKTPHIDAIDPVKGSKGTFITITGKNFGTTLGAVRFKNGGYENLVVAPLNCGPTWTPNQIIIKVPNDLALNTYDLQVRTLVNGTLTYSNAVSFIVNSDPLHAGFCSIQPDNGPVGTQVTLKGENFDLAGTVEYWKSVSSSFAGSVTPPRSFLDSQIVDLIPTGTKTGKVSVWTPSRSNYSNSLNFKIQNCQDELKKPNNTLTEVCGSPETKCCGNGVCVANTVLCPEEEAPKFSVYGWAFTTDIWGKNYCVPGTVGCPVQQFPKNIPRVLQQCGTFCTELLSGDINFSEPCQTSSECSTKYGETDYVCNSVVPSPSPSAMWPHSADICINANINVLFNLSITDNGTPLTNINAQDVVVITKSGNNTPILGSYVISSLTDGISFIPASEFSTGTVYNVLVTTKAMSNLDAKYASNMLPNLSCPEFQGTKAAYCFSFTTKNTQEKCKIGSATIKPFVTVTSTLNSTLSNFYQVYALAENNDCVSLNANSYDWNWHPSDATTPTPLASSIYSSVSNQDTTPADSNVDSVQNLTIKNLETTANAEVITATWNQDPYNAVFANKIHGTAYLTLAQKKPEVVDFWPTCTGVCRNGEIGFTFNIPVQKKSLMLLTNYDSNVSLEKCPNTLCTGGTTTPIDIQDSSGNTLTTSISGSDTKFIIAPQDGYPLLPDKYYRVMIRNASSTEGASLFVKDGANKFFSSNVFYWVFHTKPGADICDIASVDVTPATGIATWVGEQVGFTSQAYGSPDQCAPQTGQKLNSSSYNWTWTSANTNVAEISQLDRGVVLSGSKKLTSYCGDGGAAQAAQNESCQTGSDCTLDCRNRSLQKAGTAACSKATDVNCCGNSNTEDNEECDLGTQNGQQGSGCTKSCLLTTKNPISINYCLAAITNIQAGGSTAAKKLDACVSIYGAISICGNGGGLEPLEPGEQCDLGSLNGQSGQPCSTSCLSKALVYGIGANQCGNKITETANKEQCDGQVGCSSDCQFNESVGDSNIDPFQFATAIGEGNVDQTFHEQTTTITATAATKPGTAEFKLQCGYHPANANCTCDVANTCGISDDTCCYKRPVVEEIKPSQQKNVCPNSLLTVQFSQIMDTASFASSSQGFYNIILAKQQPAAAVTCPVGEYQVTKEEIKPNGIWQHIKFFVRNLFGLPAQAYIFCEGSIKYELQSEVIAGDKTKVSILLDKPLEKTQSYKLIVKDSVKSIYGVSLFATSLDTKDFSTKDSICKITDVDLTPSGWLFTTTKDDIKDNDAADDSTYDKNNNDSDKVFTAHAFFTDPLVLSAPGEELQPFSSIYSWNYNWAVSQSSNSVTISSISEHDGWQKVLAPPDAINGIAQVGVSFNVNVDTSADSEIGKTFSTTSTVQVFICDNPWPDKFPNRNFHTAVPGLGLGYFDVLDAGEQVYDGSPLEKGKAWTNFRLLYCRDNGKSNDITDDLPELKKPVALYHQSAADPILKEFFMTFDPTSGDKDSIGIRVYPNASHSSLMAWYKSQPWIPIGAPSPVKIGNYEALQEGRTYYINGLNTSSTPSGNLIYSNVYVFSFSDNPTNDTLNIVKQLIDNFELNANLIYGHLNDIAPMYRDFTRLQDLQATTKLLALYRQNNKAYPQLNENPTLGTFLPGYTNSKWNSWQGVLGNLLGTAMPVDPLNGFNGCSSATLKILDTTIIPNQEITLENFDANTCWNAGSLKFACPLGSHVYQYKFDTGTYIRLNANFELPDTDWAWDHPLVNTCSNSGNLCVDASECTTGETCDNNSILFTLNSSSCHNEILTSASKCGVCQPGEQVSESCTPLDDPTTPLPFNESQYAGSKIKICKNDCSNFVADPNSSLAHWWKADGNLLDSVGTANAVADSSFSYVTGFDTKGKAFDLSAHSTSLGISNLSPLSNEFSLSLWVKIKSFSTAGNPFFSATKSDGSVIFSVGQNSNKNVEVRGTLSSGFQYVSQDVQLNIGSWQHVAFVKSANSCSFYVNSQNYNFTSQNLDNCKSADLSFLNKAFIGSYNFKLFNGAIDDVRLYSKALSATEINDLYNNKALPQCVPQGFCGDGVRQGPEVCDDGSNNGKPGYCNADCLDKNIVCGNQLLDAGKEICDSSTFTSRWCSGNNLIDCTSNSSLCTGSSGTCVQSGEKYSKKSTDQSCAWDCQSKEFCGDKIVQPQYETCEASESCQVGQCINSGTANNGNFCEKNEDCQANIVCDTTAQTCKNGSEDLKISCSTTADCLPSVQCTSYVPGKKYCQAPGEFTFLEQSVSGKTVYIDATTTAKISENDSFFSSPSNLGCHWHTNPSAKAMSGVYCLPSAPIVLPPQSNSCGIDADKDGSYLDTGEDCDNGPANGDIPPLAYNETKTYCDFGCKVVPVSSGLYCGNGTVETPPESCDVGKSTDLSPTTAGSNPTNFCETVATSWPKAFQYQSCANNCGSFLGCPTGFKQCADKTICPEIFCGNGIEDKVAPFNEVCDASKDYKTGVTLATVIANPVNFCVNNSDNTKAPQLKYESCLNSCKNFDNLSCGAGWTACADATTNSTCSLALCGNGTLDNTGNAHEECDTGITNSFFCAEKNSLKITPAVCSSQCKFPSCDPVKEVFCADAVDCPEIKIDIGVKVKSGVTKDYADSQFKFLLIETTNNPNETITIKDIIKSFDSFSFRVKKGSTYQLKISAIQAGGGFAQGDFLFDNTKITLSGPVSYTTSNAWDKMIAVEGNLINAAAGSKIQTEQGDLISGEISSGVGYREFRIAMPQTCANWDVWLNSFTNNNPLDFTNKQGFCVDGSTGNDGVYPVGESNGGYVMYNLTVK